jgi:hypothetical protein
VMELCVPVYQITVMGLYTGTQSPNTVIWYTGTQSPITVIWYTGTQSSITVIWYTGNGDCTDVFGRYNN